MTRSLATFRLLLLSAILLAAQWVSAEHSIEELDSKHSHAAECVVCLFDSSSDPSLTQELQVPAEQRAVKLQLFSAVGQAVSFRACYPARAPPVLTV